MNSENNVLTNILVGIVVFSIILNILFVFKIADFRRNSEQIKQLPSEEKSLNQNVVNFIKLFVQDVLKADKKVDEETRAELDNAIKYIGDEGISNSWEIFSNSKTEIEAQINVKNLIEDLINKLEK
ncbi:MAG: hypothetical protein AAB371_00795 [Patescibacteria group bacterium]